MYKVKGIVKETTGFARKEEIGSNKGGKKKLSDYGTSKSKCRKNFFFFFR